MANPVYKRVLLKISGEALAGGKGSGLDFEMIGTVCDTIKQCVELGVEVGIVIGGEVDVILHVAPDVAIGLLDPLIGPDVGLHRGAQTDAHVHTQETGIYFFEIIFLHGNAPVLLEIA